MSDGSAEASGGWTQVLAVSRVSEGAPHWCPVSGYSVLGSVAYQRERECVCVCVCVCVCTHAHASFCSVGRIGKRSPKWRWLQDKEGQRKVRGPE